MMNLDEQAKVLLASCKDLEAEAKSTGSRDAENLFFLTTHVVSKQQEELANLRNKIQSMESSQTTRHLFSSLVAFGISTILVYSLYLHLFDDTREFSLGGLIYGLGVITISIATLQQGVESVFYNGFKIFSRKPK